MECHLMTKYVDDVFVFLNRIGNGKRWNEERDMIEWNEEYKYIINILCH